MEHVTHGDCIGGIPEHRVWHNLAVYINHEKVEAYLDGSLLIKTEQTFDSQPSRIGAAVWYFYDISASFKEFHIEEYYAPIWSFPNTDSVQLPLLHDIVEDHEIKTVLGSQVSSNKTYSVSADFHYITGAFGLCYNILDADNFDFVYYR